MASLDYAGLSYFKDRQDGTLAFVEKASTSSHAYGIGKYFWVEGNYCKAIQPIAVGDTLVQNTNYEVVLMGNELSDVKIGFESLGLSVVNGEINITYNV